MKHSGTCPKVGVEERAEIRFCFSRMNVWFIVNYYRAIFVTSPKFWTGDRLLLRGTAEVHYSSPAYN